MGIETALIVGAMAATAGATAYSSHQESKAAKKAAEAQERVGMEQIAAAENSSRLAAEEAKAKLKLKQASKTPTILSDMDTSGQVSQRTLLGV
jgi:nicotinic acid mononucleotide adenylyltransferase